MPQIANQDYQNSSISYRGMVPLAGAIQRGTIFDCVMNDGDIKARPLGIYYNDYGYPVVLRVNRSGTIETLTITNTPEQYTVMADISDGGCDPGSLSVDENGHLHEMDTELHVCVDGKYIAVTLDDNGNIASYVVTDVEAVGVTPVNIPEQDLPGLIGIYAGN